VLISPLLRCKRWRGTLWRSTTPAAWRRSAGRNFRRSCTRRGRRSGSSTGRGWPLAWRGRPSRCVSSTTRCACGRRTILDSDGMGVDLSSCQLSGRHSVVVRSHEVIACSRCAQTVVTINAPTSDQAWIPAFAAADRSRHVRGELERLPALKCSHGLGTECALTCALPNPPAWIASIYHAALRTGPEGRGHGGGAPAARSERAGGYARGGAGLQPGLPGAPGRWCAMQILHHTRAHACPH